METYFAIWTRVIMWVGLFALSILVPVVCAAKMFPFVNGAFSKFRKLPKWEQVFAMFIVVVLTIYAGTKPHSPKITFENGLRNDGSLVTNDTVHIEWVKTGTPYIPDGAALYIDYRPYTATNEEWGLLGQTTVGAYEFNTTLANATNYDYNVWYFYVPPEPVHTNGVWTYKTMPAKTQTPDTLKAIPLRAVTEGDGRIIATPGAKSQSEN